MTSGYLENDKRTHLIKLKFKVKRALTTWQKDTHMTKVTFTCQVDLYYMTKGHSHDKNDTQVSSGPQLNDERTFT